MEEVKAILVSNIEWDAPKSAQLPHEIFIGITEETKYLLDDVDEYAARVCDYVSDAYGYCIKGFNVECK